MAGTGDTMRQGGGRKIVLLGTGPSSRHLCPFDDEEAEIWACSPGNAKIPRFDRFYETHDWAELKRIDGDGTEYTDFLTEAADKVYVFSELLSPRFPAARPIQRADIEGKFGPHFLTSTIAWKMAEALYEHDQGFTVREIGLWGIDMAHEDEYIAQRPGCWHFIAEAANRGIPVRIPPTSSLVRAPLPYPFNDIRPERKALEARRDVFQKSLDELRAKIRKLEHDEAAVVGVLDQIDWDLRNLF